MRSQVCNAEHRQARAVARSCLAVASAPARRFGRDFEERQSTTVESIPVGRVGQPGDIAHTASLLVSPEAGFVSGQVIYVAGGPAA